jgi:hypothetical protein
MPESGPYGSVRGARGNSRPYRDPGSGSTKLKVSITSPLSGASRRATAQDASVQMIDTSVISGRDRSRDSRGMQLGNATMIAEQQQRAAERDAALRDVLRPMIGLPSREIAAKLTALGIETPRGGMAWSHVTVQRVMARLGW